MRCALDRIVYGDSESLSVDERSVLTHIAGRDRRPVPVQLFRAGDPHLAPSPIAKSLILRYLGGCAIRQVEGVYLSC
jgi:hypothetical protein